MADHAEASARAAAIQRNPNADLKPTKTPIANWQDADAATRNDWDNHEFVTIDPYEMGRGVWRNYKLLISATVPRPIALASTVSADGKQANLAPFSFWQCASIDPPMYSISFVGRNSNHILANLLETKEMCISMTSDWLVEAANFASTNSPMNVSEWDLSGLTQKESDLVKPAHVAESPYSVECRLHSTQEFFSKTDPSVQTSTLVVVEVVRFHIWEDALGEDRATADVTKLRPVFRAGGSCTAPVQMHLKYCARPLLENCEMMERSGFYCRLQSNFARLLLRLLATA
ncbi:hypothetical protein BDV18DRAFT_142001 [Aspergillus unguis]